MLPPVTVALLLSATTTQVRIPIKDLTPAQREALPGTVTLKVTELTPEQLHTARAGLERELGGDDLRPGYIGGLITAGALTAIGGGVCAALGVALAMVPYAGGEASPLMLMGGAVATIGGLIMFGVGLNRASTRATCLERIEELDAAIKARSAFREGPATKGGKKFAPVIRFTVAEF